MISKAVYKKLKETRLFSDSQKVQIFALLPDASEEDMKKLEAGIDTFDAKYREAVNGKSEAIQTMLDDAVEQMDAEDLQKNQEAIDEISLGLALLGP